MAVGISTERKDALAKVSGRAKYTEDFAVKGMKHAVYVRSTIAHGRVVRINAEKAQALPGVRAVFTYAMCRRLNLPPPAIHTPLIGRPGMSKTGCC